LPETFANDEATISMALCNSEGRTGSWSLHSDLGLESGIRTVPTGYFPRADKLYCRPVWSEITVMSPTSI